MSGALDTINSFDEATKVGLGSSRKLSSDRRRISGQPLVHEQDIRLMFARVLMMAEEKRLLCDTPLRHGSGIR